MKRENVSFMDIVCLGIGSCIYMYLLEEEERKRRKRRNNRIIGSFILLSVGFSIWFLMR